MTESMNQALKLKIVLQFYLRLGLLKGQCAYISFNECCLALSLSHINETLILSCSWIVSLYFGSFVYQESIGIWTIGLFI
jgi:hypothetical protein